MEPGPGVGGPGPGVIPVPGQGAINPGMGAMQASYMEDASYYNDGGGAGAGCYSGGCMPGGGVGMPPTSQVSFLGEEPLQISWDVSGQGCFDSNPLLVPGKQDFSQGAVYRLQVSNLPGRESVSLYPTLEVAPVTPRTDAYLAHAPVPVQFTEEDFDQVLSGNFVTKVIYLPDPEFTEVALAGVETLVSTRLDPGVDPIAEADRRGSILAILRMGNKDLSRNGAYGNGAGGVIPAQYQDGFHQSAPEMMMPESVPAPAMEGHYMGEYDSSYQEGSIGAEYAGECYGGNCGPSGFAMNMPMGAPTVGFAPQGVPPHQVPNMAPQWGMPTSGTPIGLPGPPHVPLGVPAGLQKHTMRNRTRVVLPGPVEEFKMTVKQRPGMNYPQPVNRVRVDETNRAPKQLFGGTVAPLVPSAIGKAFGSLRAAAHNADCQCEHCR
ncbi:MAG: hypothetical protein ACR2NU_12425 [Aeoliella sp.]